MSESATLKMLQETWAALPHHDAPQVILVHPDVAAIFLILERSMREKWNWRREKRELRKGVKSVYRRSK